MLLAEASSPPRLGENAFNHLRPLRFPSSFLFVLSAFPQKLLSLQLPRECAEKERRADEKEKVEKEMVEEEKKKCGHQVRKKRGRGWRVFTHISLFAAKNGEMNGRGI